MRKEPLRAADAESLFHELTGRVDACLVRRGCFEIIEARGNRYVQYLVDGDGGLVLETVSNQYLTGADRLSATVELRLLHLGWRAPDDHSPNWHRPILEPWPWPAPLAAQVLFRTLVEVHHADLSSLTICGSCAVPGVRVPPCSGTAPVPW